MNITKLAFDINPINFKEILYTVVDKDKLVKLRESTIRTVPRFHIDLQHEHSVKETEGNFKFDKLSKELSSNTRFIIEGITDSKISLTYF